MGLFGFVNDSWLLWQWSLYKQTQYGGLIDMGTHVLVFFYTIILIINVTFLFLGLWTSFKEEFQQSLLELFYNQNHMSSASILL